MEFYNDIIFEVHEGSKSFCVMIGSGAHQSVQKVYWSCNDRDSSWTRYWKDTALAVFFRLPHVTIQNFQLLSWLDMFTISCYCIESQFGRTKMKIGLCLIVLVTLSACSGRSIDCRYSEVDGVVTENTCVTKTWWRNHSHQRNVASVAFVFLYNQLLQYLNTTPDILPLPIQFWKPGFLPAK